MKNIGQIMNAVAKTVKGLTGGDIEFGPNFRNPGREDIEILPLTVGGRWIADLSFVYNGRYITAIQYQGDNIFANPKPVNGEHRGTIRLTSVADNKGTLYRTDSYRHAKFVGKPNPAWKR